MLAGLVFIFFSNVFATIAPLYVRYGIDGVKNGADAGTLFRYAAILVALAAAAGVFLYLTRQTIIVASREIEYDLRNDFFAHIQTLSLRYFQNTSTGDIMAYATNDINAVRNFIGPAVMYTSDTAMAFVFTLAMMIAINPMLTLWVLLPLPVLSYAIYFLGNKTHHLFDDVQAHYARLTTKAQENISGVRVVKAYVREEYEKKEFGDLSWQYLEKNMRLARVQALFQPVAFLIIGASMVIIVWVGGKDVMAARMTLGEVAQFMIYLGMLIWPMIAIGWVTNLVQRSAASMARLLKVLHTKPEITDSAKTDHSINNLNGDICFEHVSFRYGEELPYVLNDISFEVKQKESLAIVGATGVGKTSLVNLITRMYDVTDGAVRIDGRDVREIPVDVLRSATGIVPQETFLFSDTLRANIMFGSGTATDAEIADAARIAELSETVEELPKKFDTVIGERGITLSGGQKQRTAIARAVIRKPSIMILDDALSAVDTNTEEKILKHLREVMRERTSIIISHRISTVKDADDIIVLADGRIAEQGSHDELVARGGLYADLNRKQLLESQLERIA